MPNTLRRPRWQTDWPIMLPAVALMLLATQATGWAQDIDGEARRATVAEAVKTAMDQHEVPGVSIAVVSDGKIDWADGFGVVRAGGDQPVTPETRFQAASISKPVAALAALRTVELRKLSLDEDVNARLTSWRIPSSPLMNGNPVTLRRLLSHSAGLTVHGFGGYATNMEVPTLVQVLSGAPPANSAPVKLLVKPGYMFKYSGGGYTVVQQLLIDVTGVPFPDYMRQMVLDPLEMEHSTYEQPLPAELAAQAAVGHRPNKAPVAGGWHVYPEMAAAGLWTTPSDLARVVVEVISTANGQPGKILSPGMVAEMLKEQSGKTVTYGLGFSVFGSERTFRFSHGGSNEGYRCMLIGLPATGQGVVIMTNSDTGGALLQQLVPIVGKTYDWPTDKRTAG